MSLKNTANSYGSMAKFFHWTISVSIIAMLCFGPFMGDIADKALRGQVYMAHKLFGITILTLVLLRVVWSLINIKPRLPALTPAWERIAVNVSHTMLYLLIIAMPLSGWIMSTAANKSPEIFGKILALPVIPNSKPLAHLFSDIHTILAITIATFVTLHVIAALKHHFINRDNILSRMLPGSRYRS